MLAKAAVLSLILGLFCLGVYDVLKNFENNNCEMTYMFEMPEYLPIKVGLSAAAKFPNYNLYFYGEGQYAQATKGSRFQLKGIPVLFIPGNAGSYRQVRSLGSVALRMAESQRAKFHFNYFALDLNEELSGIYGPFLSDQTEFAYHCIKRILRLYSHLPNNQPKSVFIVGHSMGGMIARALYTLPDFDKTLVSGILTQATPHVMPVIAIDPVLANFYHQVNEHWANSLGRDVLIVSTGGGYRDILVRTGLTSLSKIVDCEHQIASSTMSIPKAWVSTDHLAHVWCKQVVLATVRAMFDCVDRKTNQISGDHSVCRDAFEYHYESNSGSKLFKTSKEDGKTVVDEKIPWRTSKERLWDYEAKQVTDGFYQATEISENKSTQFALVALTNTDKFPWIGGCSVPPGAARCKEITSFDHEARLIPPNKLKIRVVHIDDSQLSGFTNWVVHIPKSSSPVKMIVDVYKVANRHLEVTLPNLVSFILKSELDILHRTEEKATFYNVTLAGLEIPLQAYVVDITSIQCAERNSDVPVAAVVKLHVPWNHEHTYATLQQGESAQLPLKLQSGRPAEFAENAQLHIYLDPSCTYRVTLRVSWSELFGQLVRFYGVYIVAFLVIQVLMVLCWQLRRLSSEGVVPSFSESHGRWAQPYRVVPVTVAIRFLITKLKVYDVVTMLGLPEDDSVILQEHDIWHRLLPLFLYVVAFAFMTLYGRLTESILTLQSKVFAICYKRWCFPSWVGTLFAGSLYILLLSGACASYWLCGTWGLIAAYLVHLIKAFAFRTKLRAAPEPSIENACNLSLSLVFLLTMILPLNSVPFVIWSKGLSREAIGLIVDPSRAAGIVASLTSIPIIYRDYSLGRNLVTVNLAWVCYVSSVLMVLYAMVSVYRVSYFVSAILFLLALSALTSKGEVRRKEKLI